MLMNTLTLEYAIVFGCLGAVNESPPPNHTRIQWAQPATKALLKIGYPKNMRGLSWGFPWKLPLKLGGESWWITVCLKAQRGKISTIQRFAKEMAQCLTSSIWRLLGWKHVEHSEATEKWIPWPGYLVMISDSICVSIGTHHLDSGYVDPSGEFP